MKKQLLIMLMLFALLITTAMAKEKDITITLNGEKLEFDQPPIIINDRTMVPMRGIFEALGSEIEWNQATQTVTAKLSDGTLTMRIGAYTASKQYTSGKLEEYTLDVPAQIVNERTLVPVRFISETLGADVEWNNALNTVIIDKKPYVVDTIKKVDIMSATFGYHFDSNEFCTFDGDNFYYVDKNSLIKKVDLYSGNETEILNFNQCIKDLSNQDHVNSDMDNIYMEGGEIHQIAYDRFGKRLIVIAYLEQPGNVYTFEISDGTLNQIMKDYRWGTSYQANERIITFLPNDIVVTNTYIDGKSGKIVDMSTSEVLSSFPMLTNPFSTYYYNNKIYAPYSSGTVHGLAVYDLNGNVEQLNNSIGSGLAFNGDFCYAINYDGYIEKFNLAGAEKGRIKFSDIAIRDGIANISGQLIFTTSGEMVVLDGNVLRSIRKND